MLKLERYVKLVEALIFYIYHSYVFLLFSIKYSCKYTKRCCINIWNSFERFFRIFATDIAVNPFANNSFFLFMFHLVEIFVLYFVSESCNFVCASLFDPFSPLLHDTLPLRDDIKYIGHPAGGIVSDTIRIVWLKLIESNFYISSRGRP